MKELAIFVAGCLFEGAFTAVMGWINRRLQSK